MPFQPGKTKGAQKQRDAKYTPNTQQNRQVEDAMKAAGVPVTAPNKEKVHRLISGQGMSYRELVAAIKILFNS